LQGTPQAAGNRTPRDLKFSPYVFVFLNYLKEPVDNRKKKFFELAARNEEKMNWGLTFITVTQQH
jgi:hypothetical protein